VVEILNYVDRAGRSPFERKTLMPTRKFETTDYLRTDRQIAAYLDAALTDGDPRVLLQAVRDVAAVRGGMAALARRAGIPRESLYRMLSSRGNPSYVAVRSILDAVGFRLSVEPGTKRPGRSTRAA
jgi:probable addiction module antidote protein